MLVNRLIDAPKPCAISETTKSPMPINKKIGATSLFIGVLAVANVALHLLFFGKLEYHRDELLYFALGLHPDFGYATVPPLIGWIAALMQSLFGFSLFAVKLFPAVLSGALVWLGALIAKKLGGKAYAQVLTAILLIIMPVSLRAFHLFQPVHIDLFLWTLLFYYVIKYVNSQKSNYLLVIGALFGVALLNKYLVALLLLALLAAISFSVHRVVFSKKEFYGGLGLGLLVFSPNLIWQLKRGLPIINHMTELEAQQLVNVDRGLFLLDQLTMPFVASIVMLAGLAYLFTQKTYRYIAISALLVVVVLLLLRGKSYYTIGVIPVLISGGAVAIEKYLTNNWVRWVLPVVFVSLTFPILPFGIPVYGQDGMIEYFKKLEDNHGLLLGRRFEDGSIHSLPQDYADQLGWEELVSITAKAYSRIPDKTRGAIYCENYGQAGAVAVIGKKYKLPEPLSFNESFAYWVPGEFQPEITHFIYINDELGEDVAALFQKVEIIGEVTNIHAREYGTTVYLCSNPKSSFNTFWKGVLQRVAQTND